MEDIDVPTFFVCPISLQIMKDPVTISSGITYDRESIEKWLFSGRNKTCPVTKQVLSSDYELTPNHTLRRLIQSWCTINASYGIERIPTPKPPMNKAQISRLINNAKSPHLQMNCLKTLKSVASESETNKRSMEAAGVVEFLASIVNYANSAVFEGTEDRIEAMKRCDEALSILYHLHISESSLEKLAGSRNGEFVQSLTRVLQRGSFESRAYSVLLLESIFEMADSSQIANLKSEFFDAIIQVLRDQISHQASKATLKLLNQICSWGRNRIKAVESNAVSTLIEILLDSSERRSCEMILMVLDILCGCAEGRSELLRHAAGLAVVSKKILRVSETANEKAVRILLSIARFSATPCVLKEMLQLGTVTKLCMVLQMDGRNKAKEKAMEILKMHGRSWRNSPCLPPNLLDTVQP